MRQNELISALNETKFPFQPAVALSHLCSRFPASKGMTLNWAALGGGQENSFLVGELGERGFFFFAGRQYQK